MDTPVDTTRLQRLKAYLEADPGNVHLIRDVAGEAMRGRDFAAAVDALNQLCSLGQAEANDEAALIHALVRLGRATEAISVAEEALARWPADEAIRLEGARARLNSRQFEGAIDWAQGSFGDESLAQMAAEITTLACWHAGRLDDAKDVGLTALKRWPDNPRLLSCTSAVLFDLDQLEPAFELAHRAHAASPAHAYEALHVLASEQIMRQDQVSALQWLDKALGITQNDGRIWLLKGTSHMAMNQMDEARHALQQATALFPGHAGSHLALAWLYISQNQLDLAEDTAQSAITASPSFGESHGTLAVVHALKGRTDDAQQSVRRALLLDREGFAARYAQTLLAGGQPEAVQTLFAEVIKRASQR